MARLVTIRPQPGREAPAAVKPVERADRCHESLLGDVLRRGVIVNDQERRAVGPTPVAAKQLLEISLGARLGTADQARSLRARVRPRAGIGRSPASVLAAAGNGSRGWARSRRIVSLTSREGARGPVSASGASAHGADASKRDHEHRPEGGEQWWHGGRERCGFDSALQAAAGRLGRGCGRPAGARGRRGAVKAVRSLDGTASYVTRAAPGAIHESAGRSALGPRDQSPAG